MRNPIALNIIIAIRAKAIEIRVNIKYANENLITPNFLIVST
jgi:hypothetical protein